MAIINGDNANNTLNGTSGDDTINGFGGNDTINGLAGNDTINGGAGNDTLNGGEDSDTYVFAIGDGLDIYGDTGLLGYDRILAGGINVVIGLRTGFGPSSGIEEISANGYTGVSIGGSNNADTLDFSSTLLTGIVAIDAGGGADNVIGSSAGDTIIGGGGNDTLSGLAGDDTIEGGAGNDTLDGGEDSDTYVVAIGDGLDTYGDTGLLGYDRIVAGGINVVIGLRTGFGPSSGIEEISANGHAGVSIAGSGGADTLDFSTTLISGITLIDSRGGADTVIGSVDNDMILGGAGNDALNGGEGSDTYLVGGSDGDDTYADSGGSGTDRILAIANNVAIGLSSGFGAASGIEEISADGHTGVTIGGSGGADSFDFSTTLLTGIVSINAGGGADTIVGSGGNDNIIGGGGDDTLDGGEGSDTLTGGTGTNLFSVTSVAGEGGDDVITDYAPTIDNIRINSAVFGTFGSLLAGATQVGADVVFDLGGGASLTLQNVSLGALDPAHFEVNDIAAADPTLAVNDAVGDEDTVIPLDVSAALQDTDGSETLALFVDDIPIGATLSDGANAFTATSGNTTANIGAWTLSSLTITPAGDSETDFTLTVRAVATEASNGDTAETIQLLNVTINPINDPPTADAVDASDDEDATAIEITLTGSDIDFGDAIETFTLATLPTSGLLYTNAELTTLAATGTPYTAVVNALTLYFVPDENFNGEAVFAYTASDGELDSDVATATITVDPVNDAPMTTPVTLTAIAEDSGARLITQVELLANASDVDSSSLTATLLAISSGNGSLVDNLDGTWSYTPAPDDDTSVSFSYIVSDGSLDASGSATLDITPEDDTPPGLDFSFVYEAPEQAVFRVSVDSSGLEGNNASSNPSVSADGRYVAFSSAASNLIADDTNSTDDIFVRDLVSGTTTRVSVDTAGSEGDGPSFAPSISSDGRYVVFISDASNLVPDDTNGQTDIFVHDLVSGTTTRVSVDSAGQEGNDFSYEPSISADGRYVTFYSSASNLVADDANGTQDVFVRDLLAGTTTRVSVDSSGLEADGVSHSASISGDGRYVAFYSEASNLVTDDTNGVGDIFVRDLVLGTTTRIAPGPIEQYSIDASFSADNRYLVFYCEASDLVPGDTNEAGDVYVYDLVSGTTTRVSVNSAGLEANDISFNPSISADGRYVTFVSDASNLVPGDLNDRGDIFVRDLVSGSTTRISIDALAQEGNEYSEAPSISTDGRYVAFTSYASNLVPGDGNETADILLADILIQSQNEERALHFNEVAVEVTPAVPVTGIEVDWGNGEVDSIAAETGNTYRLRGQYEPGTVATATITDLNGTAIVAAESFSVQSAPAFGPTLRVSVSSSEQQSDNASYAPSISADGRYVAFSSAASNLVPDDTNDTGDIFVRDLVSGTTTRVSLDSAGQEGSDFSDTPSISADGRYVAFVSLASNLVADDTNGAGDIFVRDLVSGITTRVSVGLTGNEGNGSSESPSISADGRYVAFYSYASDLVTDDTNGVADIFVRDLLSGTTTRVSVDSAGSEANDGSGEPSISADGRYVTFVSSASNLVAGDTNGTGDVFVYDLLLGTTTRISLDSAALEANGGSGQPSISADGRYVAFYSDASNLVADDTNSLGDIFVHDLVLGTTTRVSVNSTGLEADGGSFEPAISADGRYVTFVSEASNLVADDTNGQGDIFVHDLSSGVTTRVSLTSAGLEVVDGGGYSPSISGDGRYVAFAADNPDLVVGDTNNNDDIFVRDREPTGATLQGSIGADLLIGEAGPDSLVGSDGNDQLSGGAGDDTLVGGLDNDTLIGGADYDIAIFNGSAAEYIVTDNGDGTFTVVGPDGTDTLEGIEDIQFTVPTPTIARVNTSAAGVQTNSYDYYDHTTVSADGRYVAFMSGAANLVPGDTFFFDIFVKDTQTGAISRVSTDGSGAQANEHSTEPTISADGRYVVFRSEASNLVVGDTNGTTDIFIKDTLTGVTTRVSTDSSGAQANLDSREADVSADGRYVVFSSSATNLVPGDTNSAPDVFMKDMQTGAVTLVSTNASGTQGNTTSGSPVVSSDGRYVAFASDATDLVAGDTNGVTDVFVKDILTGSIVNITQGALGGASFLPSISADGQYVAFRSEAGDLVPDDTNGVSDVFVWSMQSGTIARVSTDASGAEGIYESNSNSHAISADGRYVVFYTDNEFTGAEFNSRWDVFIKDIVTGEIWLASTNESGVVANDHSYDAAIAAGGTHVTFASFATNLVPDDTNTGADAFLFSGFA